MALTTLTPRHQVGADSLAKLVVELILGQRTTVAERIRRRLRNFVERIRGSDARLDGQLLELPTKLCTQLIVVGRYQRTSVEAKVRGRQHMNRAPNDVGYDEFALVDSLVVGFSPEVLPSRGEREQGRISSEVGGRACRRVGKTSGIAADEP